MKWALSVGLLTGTGNAALAPVQHPPRVRRRQAVLLRYVTGTDVGGAYGRLHFPVRKRVISATFYARLPARLLRQSITQDKLLAGWNIGFADNRSAPGKFLGQRLHKTERLRCCGQRRFGNAVYNITGDGYLRRRRQADAAIWTSFVPNDSRGRRRSSDKWEEVSVTVGEYWNSPGMLTLPKGVQKPPVVILVQGSGASRHERGARHSAEPSRLRISPAAWPGRESRRLRYNKRTYQYPAGGAPTIQYEMLDDAAAAVTAARRRQLGWTPAASICSGTASAG